MKENLTLYFFVFIIIGTVIIVVILRYHFDEQ